MAGSAQFVRYNGLTTSAAIVEKCMRESNCLVLNNWPDLAITSWKGLTRNIKGTLLARKEWSLQPQALLLKPAAVIRQ